MLPDDYLVIYGSINTASTMQPNAVNLRPPGLPVSRWHAVDPPDSQPPAAAAQGPSGFKAAETKQGLGTLAPSSWSQNVVPWGQGMVAVSHEGRLPGSLRATLGALLPHVDGGGSQSAGPPGPCHSELLAGTDGEPSHELLIPDLFPSG